MLGLPVQTSRLSARVPDETRQRAEEAAREMGLTISEYIRLLIDVATLPERERERETPPRRAKRRRPGT